VDHLGQLLLAGAGGTRDQHRHVGCGDARCERDELPHRGALDHHPAEVDRRCGRGAADGRGSGRGRSAQPLSYGRDQPGVVPGLLQVVDRAFAGQPDRRLQVDPGGEQDHRQPRRAPAELGEERHPLLARGRPRGEVHVLEDEVDRLRVEAGERRFGAAGDHRGDVVQLQQEGERARHPLLVLDDEHAGHDRLRR
jgi:hypothetical protein